MNNKMLDKCLSQRVIKFENARPENARYHQSLSPQARWYLSKILKMMLMSTLASNAKLRDHNVALVIGDHVQELQQFRIASGDKISKAHYEASRKRLSLCIFKNKKQIVCTPCSFIKINNFNFQSSRF